MLHMSAIFSWLQFYLGLCGYLTELQTDAMLVQDFTDSVPLQEELKQAMSESLHNWMAQISDSESCILLL